MKVIVAERDSRTRTSRLAKRVFDRHTASLLALPGRIKRDAKRVRLVPLILRRKAFESGFAAVHFHVKIPSAEGFFLWKDRIHEFQIAVARIDQLIANVNPQFGSLPRNKMNLARFLEDSIARRERHPARARAQHDGNNWSGRERGFMNALQDGKILPGRNDGKKTEKCESADHLQGISRHQDPAKRRRIWASLAPRWRAVTIALACVSGTPCCASLRSVDSRMPTFFMRAKEAPPSTGFPCAW